MPKARVFEFEVNTEQLKTCKSPAIGQIPPDLIKGGVGKFVPTYWFHLYRGIA